MGKVKTQMELVDTLLEIATELDTGNDADISWLKYQGDVLREAADLIHSLCGHMWGVTENE